MHVIQLLTFIHISVGSGIPFGGPHSNKAVSPLATRVSLGCARKSSRKTVTIATKIDINTLANVCVHTLGMRNIFHYKSFIKKISRRTYNIRTYAENEMVI